MYSSKGFPKRRINLSGQILSEKLRYDITLSFKDISLVRQ
jgi:hypothetical protein